MVARFSPRWQEKLFLSIVCTGGKKIFEKRVRSQPKVHLQGIFQSFSSWSLLISRVKRCFNIVPYCDKRICVFIRICKVFLTQAQTRSWGWSINCFIIVYMKKILLFKCIIQFFHVIKNVIVVDLHVHFLPDNASQ